PPAIRRSQPPPSSSAAPATRRVSAPPPARNSTPPPAMLFSTSAAEEIEEEAPVSVRRPSVGPQSRRVVRAGLGAPFRAKPVDEAPRALASQPSTEPAGGKAQSSIPPALVIAVDPTMIGLGDEAPGPEPALDKITRFALPELEK